MDIKNELEVKVCPKRAKDVIQTLKDKDPCAVYMLGEDWVDGYKTGIIDTLIMLGIRESELEELMKNHSPLKQTISSL